MTTKEKVLRAVNNLPDNASIEDVVKRLQFLVEMEQRLDARQPIAIQRSTREWPDD